MERRRERQREAERAEIEREILKPSEDADIH
jgi:hypothetical protein